MPGGNFDKLVGKTRPGTYVNYESTRTDLITLSDRGIVIMPLSLTWGPVQQFITINNSAPDEQFAKLGYSIYEDDPKGNMLLIREAFKKAQKVIVYRLTGGVKATATVGSLTATAVYEGSRGNSLKLVIESNPIAGYDVYIYLGTTKVFEQIGVSTIGDLEENEWIVWSGEATSELTATAGTALAGGNDTDQTNADVTKFLDDSEIIVWNTMCFPFEDATLQAALKTKIQYFRDDVGKKVAAVAPGFQANYEGIIGVDNGVILGDGTEIDKVKACAWVAAADAAATNTKSNTYLAYDGAVDVLGKKTNEEAIDAINKGFLFFSAINGSVVVEYDINSLTDFNPPKSKDYRKNRVRRVLDTFDESLQLNFPPNKFDNSPDGWDLMESLGKQLLISFRDAGAIKDVDLDADFLVDRSSSVGDETYFDIGIAPVDSAEKLYFTVRTR
jgi:hypothetical protein